MQHSFSYTRSLKNGSYRQRAVQVAAVTMAASVYSQVNALGDISDDPELERLQDENRKLAILQWVLVGIIVLLVLVILLLFKIARTYKLSLISAESKLQTLLLQSEASFMHTPMPPSKPGQWRKYHSASDIWLTGTPREELFDKARFMERLQSEENANSHGCGVEISTNAKHRILEEENLDLSDEPSIDDF